MGVDGYVGQGKDRFPLTLQSARLDNETERCGPRHSLVSRWCRRVALGMQERRRMVVVGDAEVILDHVADLESACGNAGRVVLVVAEGTAEGHPQRRAVCVDGAAEEDTAAGL